MWFECVSFPRYILKLGPVVVILRGGPFGKQLNYENLTPMNDSQPYKGLEKLV